ncbi:LeuA family protein [Amycolatopsis lurida]
MSSEEPRAAAPGWVETIDCTLRDGEQAPGVAFTIAEKLEIATALSDAGVDVLDAGFPGSGAAEVETLQELHRQGLKAKIGATARPFPGDVAAADAAHADEVFLFMPTSDIRIEKTLGTTRSRAADFLVAGAENVVSCGMGLNVVFEDATRARPEFLLETTERIAGAVPVRRVIIADTVGCATPDSMSALVRRFLGAFAGSLVVCPHCHNDFGLATANTLQAVLAGCTSLTCTVNGLGERAGNADLAEVAAALGHLHGIGHGIDLTALPALAELVERRSGVHTSFTKPVTGLNVFRHESGVHVDAMLKSTDSYEFLPSDAIGRRTEFVLGKHSGRALVHTLLGELKPGPADEDTVTQVLAAVKGRYAHADKFAHDRLHEQRRRFFAEHLSGLDRDELKRLAGPAAQPVGD